MSRKPSCRPLGFLCAAAPWLLRAFACGPAAADERAAPHFEVPPGFVVERVAAPPLVRYPLFAAFDDRGRLFVAEGTGTNLPGTDLEKKKLGRILLLEDSDGDGTFDSSTVFADGFVFPQGVLWHAGSLYVASHPSLWRLADSDGDGRADVREPLVSEFRFNGNGCDIHGPFLGPDGWIYWTDGRHGYRVETREGQRLEGLASRIWRCRPDGSGIERICGGGFDNPVELAFTPEGELVGTMDQGPGDALLHYIEGGVYPMEHECLKEFPRTGPLLGSISQFSAAVPVALCGLTRYRSAQFGPEYQDTFFTAQFNVHRVQQHVLVPDGATFHGIDKDFLTSNDPDVHLTDVVEDADGSLLVVDMGAWFNYGCPTSKIAKPEVLGAIYRVRRAGAPELSDPWGKKLDLAAMTAVQLAGLLDDFRPKLRDRVMDELAARGGDVVTELAAAARAARAGSTGRTRSVEARRNAVWALARIGTAEARRVVRVSINDPERSVRQVAVRCAGLTRDPEAVAPLARVLAESDPGLRLAAATALGRMGQSHAVPPLLDNLRRSPSDRFLEHGIVYALLRIADRDATRPGLVDSNPRVRRGALIALDQMQGGDLTRELVTPLLDSDDPDLLEATLAVVSRHPSWSGEIAGLIENWLGDAALSATQQASLQGALLAFSGESNIQRLVADALSAAKTPVEKRLLLLRVLARCRLERLPREWAAGLARALGDADERVAAEAVATVETRGLSGFDKQLIELSQRPALPEAVRIAAVAMVARRQPRPDDASFQLFVTHLGEETEPLVRLAAARGVAASRLDRPQLERLCASIAQAGPLVLPVLVPAFAASRDADLGRALVAALERSPGAGALAADDLSRLLAGYPAEVAAAAEPLVRKLATRQTQQAAYLAQVTARLARHSPNPQRGRQVFFSKKAGCYGCHRLDGQGGAVGPDLSKIAQIRGPRDLLESIVFPSSSIGPEYRQYVIAAQDGRVVTGMIAREDSEAIYLRTAELAEIRIPRGDIADMRESAVSIMPAGLDQAMTAEELSDLVEFLYERR